MTASIHRIKGKKRYRIYQGKAYHGFATTWKDPQEKAKHINAVMKKSSSKGSGLSSGQGPSLMPYKHIRKTRPMTNCGMPQSCGSTAEERKHTSGAQILWQVRRPWRRNLGDNNQGHFPG